MAELPGIFLISFAFSFLGSIPPGSINLSVLQLSLDGNKMAAYRFALAAALIEYPYAYIALKFESYLSDTKWLQDNFHLLSAIVMISLGLIGLWQGRRPVGKQGKFQRSGFRKGLFISILNPLAIPFWIGVTAYLKAEKWVKLPDEISIHIYIIGVSAGTFVLLVFVAYFANAFGDKMRANKNIRILPAMVFLVLGAYSLTKLII